MQMIPYVATATSDAYPSSGQDERCLDIAKSLELFDIVCIQECFGGIYSEIREKFLAYCTTVGFIYIVDDGEPGFSSSFMCDGGLLIMSRLPIVAKSYEAFSWS